MHGLSHLPVLADLPGPGELGAEGRQAAPQVRRDAPGHDEPDPAPGPLRVEGGQLGKTPLGLLKIRVHGTHKHSIAQGGEAEVEGGQQVGVGHRGSGGSGQCRTEPGLPGAKTGGGRMSGSIRILILILKIIITIFKKNV